MNLFRIFVLMNAVNFFLPLWAEVPSSDRARHVILSQKEKLSDELRTQGLEYGVPIFIRIFKEEAELELWGESDHGQFKLFKTYPVCRFSGRLGPKVKEGDMQSPEGFYFVTPEQLNPWSRYHLAFNLGYPNAYDRYHGRTGDYLMVHGQCVSIGCYAMTDHNMNEIYTLAVAAFENGQLFFRVHIFPFRMNSEKMKLYREHKWYLFWMNLQEGYDFFERDLRPPNTTVSDGRYVFDEG